MHRQQSTAQDPFPERYIHEYVSILVLYDTMPSIPTPDFNHISFSPLRGTEGRDGGLPPLPPLSSIPFYTFDTRETRQIKTIFIPARVLNPV